MKRYLILTSFIAIALVACQKENLSEQAVTGNSIYATIEQPADETKTTLAGTSVQWVAADAIKLWDSDGSTGVYTTTTSGADVEFTAVSSEATVDVNKQLYGFYPSDHFVSKTGSNITFSITGEQGYVANSFGDNSNYAVADKPAAGTGDNKLHFKNVAGVLKIQLSVEEGDAATVGKIVLSSNADEPDASKYICGTFTVDASAAEPVASYVSAGDTTITLNCGTAGVALSDDSSNPTTFHIVVPAGSFTTGFTAKVYSLQDHLITTLSSTKSQTIARSVVRMMKNKEVNWLPAGYTECEYISTEGGTSGPVMNSGVAPYYGMNIYIKFGFVPHFTYADEESTQYRSGMIFGCEDNKLTTLFDFSISARDYSVTTYSSPSARFMGVNGTYETIEGKISYYNPLGIYEGMLNIQSYEIQFRETTSYMELTSSSTPQKYKINNATDRPTMCDKPMAFFGVNDWAGIRSLLTNFRLYEFSIENSTGVGSPSDKERRFIPVQNNELEFGTYDLITRGFFGNVGGTGSFTGSN